MSVPTKGPYEAVRLPDGIAIASSVADPEGNRSFVAHIVFGDFDPQVAKANANLLAAAPEMLELLKECRALLYNGIKQDLVKKLNQAILKAGGK